MIENSLINPNQLRASGVPVSDDPFDETREFGIHHEELCILFKTRGSKVYFVTHVPTDVELQICKHIIMTNYSEWESNSTLFIKSLSREQIERGRIHKIDVVLVSVSNSLVKGKATEWLIADVNI